MKFLNNLKIGLRLNLVLSLVMIIIVLLLGIYTIISQKNKIIADTDLRISEQVNDLTNFVEHEIQLNQQRVNTGLAYAEQYFNNSGKIEIEFDDAINYNAINQITGQIAKVQVNPWYYDGKILQESFDMVDNIVEKIGGSATIFQKIPQGYLRISTNILKKDGNRGTGTYIPNSSPVAQAINNSTSYFGRAYIVNDWYLTAYKPIILENEVIGIIYYGLPEKNLVELRNMFKEKKYFDTGYPYIVAKNGDVIIHPTKENESFLGEKFFEDMLSSKNTTGKSEYVWEGKKKLQYFKYVESIDSYVSATLYEEELMGIINK